MLCAARSFKGTPLSHTKPLDALFSFYFFAVFVCEGAGVNMGFSRLLDGGRWCKGKESARYFAPGENAIHFYNAAATVTEPASLSQQWNSSWARNPRSSDDEFVRMLRANVPRALQSNTSRELTYETHRHPHRRTATINETIGLIKFTAFRERQVW